MMIFQPEEKPVYCGEVYYISHKKEMPTDVHCSIGGGRPALIISNNGIGLHSTIVLVAYITNKAPTSPYDVWFPGQDGLRSGTFEVDKIVGISKARIGEYITSLPKEYMNLIRHKLVEVFDLKNIVSEEETNDD